MTNKINNLVPDNNRLADQELNKPKVGISRENYPTQITENKENILPSSNLLKLNFLGAFKIN